MILEESERRRIAAKGPSPSLIISTPELKSTKVKYFQYTTFDSEHQFDLKKKKKKKKKKIIKKKKKKKKIKKKKRKPKE